MELSRRIDELHARSAEHLTGPVERLFARLICDGCGAVAYVDPERPVYPSGWSNRGPGDDRCPSCG